MVAVWAAVVLVPATSLGWLIFCHRISVQPLQRLKDHALPNAVQSDTVTDDGITKLQKG